MLDLHRLYTRPAAGPVEGVAPILASTRWRRLRPGRREERYRRAPDRHVETEL
jgi:hypothetical protein